MKKPFILVADDEKESRLTIINFLKRSHCCDFAEAKNGEEAIEFLKIHPCDIIMIDIKMPKKNGILLIKEAKQIDPKVDIIVISAWVSDEVSREAIESGATDYLVKPIDLAILSMKVSELLLKKGYEVNKT
jgi:YesN/AraC family two-component response regulator